MGIGEAAFYLLPRKLSEYFGLNSPFLHPLKKAAKENYYKEKFRSFMWQGVSYSLAARTVYQLGSQKSPQAILSSTVATAVSCILWKRYGNASWTLSQETWKAIKKQDTKKALECINQGADIYRQKQGRPILIDLMPFLPPIYDHEFSPSRGLIVHAANHGLHEVVQKLISLGAQTPEDLMWALYFCKNVATADHLIRAGAEINPNIVGCSLLNYQMLDTTNGDGKYRTPNEKQEYIRSRLFVIQYLIDKGARWYSSEDCEKGYYISKLKDWSENSDYALIKSDIDETIEKLQNLGKDPLSTDVDNMKKKIE